MTFRTLIKQSFEKGLGKGYIRDPKPSGSFYDPPQPQAHKFGGMSEKARVLKTTKTLAARPLDKSPGSSFQRKEVTEGIRKRQAKEKQKAIKTRTIQRVGTQSRPTVGGGSGRGRFSMQPFQVGRKLL